MREGAAKKDGKTAVGEDFGEDWGGKREAKTAQKLIKKRTEKRTDKKEVKRQSNGEPKVRCGGRTGPALLKQKAGLARIGTDLAQRLV